MDGLDLLLSSLTTAVGALQSSLKSQNLPPFDLDDPKAHPLDYGLPDPVSWYARKMIVGLCNQIIATVQSPMERATVGGLSFTLSAAMAVVCQTEPPLGDLISAAGPSGVHVAELAAQNGIDPNKLESVLHVLTSNGYFKEVSTRTYAVNRPAGVLVTGGVITELVPFWTQCMGPATLLSQSVRLSARINQPTAFELFHKVPVFTFLAQNEYIRPRFHRGMTDVERYIDRSLPIDYPWESLGQKITIVDIGGGRGGVTMDLLKRFSGWTAILQDLPEVISAAKEFWRANAPEMVAAERITFLSHDMFKSSVLPPSPPDSPYVFVIKHVLHNWPDDACIKILNATSPVSTLLVINDTPNTMNFDANHPDVNHPDVSEYFRELHGKSMETIQSLHLQAPLPLGVRWGYGSAYMAALDALMLTVFNGRTRTEEDFKDLFRATSWKLDSTTELRAIASVVKAVR